MALSSKALFALMVVAMVLVASMGPGMANEPDDCFCPCMKDQCMTIGGSTKEDCAQACNNGCKEAGYGGQPDGSEFCGF